MKKFKNFKNKWSTNTQAKLCTMKYHRFSRRRKNYLGLYDYFRSKKKSDYMILTGRSKILDSGSFDNRVWSTLHKAWQGYVIAKNKDEYGKMERCARIVQESQYDLGLEVSSFDNIGMSATSFLWELAQKDADNQEQEASDDTYIEDFRDDYDNVDRFTDDNAYREKFTDNYH